MEFDRILPDNVSELAPLGRIVVHRELVLGYDFETGNPLTRIMDIRTFDGVKESLEWISSSPDCLHKVGIPLAGASLIAKVEEDEMGQKKFFLQSPLRTGASPEIVKGCYSVVLDGIFLYIVAELDPSQDVLFEKGMAALVLSKGSPPSLQFIFNPGEHSKEELADGITRMMKKVNFVVDKLLEGVYGNPKE